jgi:hypothetical protein
MMGTEEMTRPTSWAWTWGRKKMGNKPKTLRSFFMGKLLVCVMLPQSNGNASHRVDRVLGAMRDNDSYEFK